MTQAKKKIIKKTTKTESEKEDIQTKSLVVTRVPTMEEVAGYVEREIHGVPERDVFEYALANKQNILLEGATGSGKTSAALHFAAVKGLPFYSVPSNISIDPSQMFGRFIPMPDGTFEWVDGGLTEIVRNGGVLVFGEVNFMAERIASVIHPLTDKRREITLLDHKGEVIKAHDNLLIVADLNPNYEGTRPLNKAFRNRFSIQIQWDYSSVVDKELIKSEALHSFVRNTRANSATIRTPLATNMVTEFQSIYWALGYKFARNNLVSHFLPVERDGVGRGLDTHRAKIEEELTAYKRQLTASGSSSTDVDNTVDNFDDLLEELSESDIIQSKYSEDHEIWEVRRNAPVGYVDHEMGIKGVDWNL